MAIDMHADIGGIFKNLFSKKGADGNKGTPADPLIKTFIAGGVAFVIAILYLSLVYFPAQAENKIKEQKIARINDLKTCITELSENIIVATKDLSSATSRYKERTNLFHTGRELDDLYRHISMLALTNQLMVSKIKKSGENPVFEIESETSQPRLAEAPPPPPPTPSTSDTNGADPLNGSMSACDKIQSSDQTSVDGGTSDEQESQNLGLPMEGILGEEESKPKKVAYYEFKVNFEITGNYANYTRFRKGLAQLKKRININQEKIIVLESETKQGEVKVTAVLAIYRLPEKSEEYVKSGDEEVLQ